MTPWIGPLFPVMARLIRDEESLGVPQHWLRYLQGEVERVGEMMDGVKVDQPATYPLLVHRLIKKQIEGGEAFATLMDLIDDIGLKHHNVPTPLLKFVDQYGEMDRFWGDDEMVLYEIEEGIYFLVEEDNYEILFNPSYPHPIERIERIIRRCAWQHAPYLEMEVGGDGIRDAYATSMEFSTYDPGEERYYGPLSELRSRVMQMVEAGERWCVLLKGRPGVGKTTFCNDIVRRFGKPTLFLSKHSFKVCTEGTWNQIVEMLQPEIIILDDIDHLSTDTLKSRMNVFSEGKIDLSLVLMTSNMLDAFPDAMKRPGRIDHIVEVDPPQDEVIDHMIEAKADVFGVDVPERVRSRLRRVHLEYSPAHLREVLKRASVWGWDDAMIWDIHKEDDDDEG